MTRVHGPHRNRLKAGTILLTGLALALPTALVETGATTAAHGVVAGDCTPAYPIAELTAGQAVHGLTVSKGTVPEGFTGEVLGVLKDGILPGQDMVIMRLTSPEIDRVGGIWQGMSGSPVYAADGRLIGAVAWGLAYGTSPVAGITPYTSMQAAATKALPKRVSVNERTVRLLTKAGVDKAAAKQGFEPLPTPLAVAGVPGKLLQRKSKRPYLPKDAYAAGSAPAVSGPADIVAGGNIGVTFSTGDITQGAFGTVTSVCNDLVRAFGHPFNLLGKTNYGMTSADTIYVQEDPLGVPFKVPNFGPTVGTVNQDRITGVSGPLGALPTGANVTWVLKHGAVSRTSQSQVTLKEALAQTVNYAAAIEHLNVLDSYPPGAEVQTWKITGRSGSTPFTLTGGNRYADPVDISFMAQWDLPDLVWMLSNLGGVTIDSVTADSTVTDDFSTFKLGTIEQRVGGAWVKLDKDTPARVKAGKKLRLRLTLANPAGKQFVPLTFKIPAKAAGARGKLWLNQAIPFPFEQGDNPTTLAGVRKLLTSMVRNDQVQAVLDLGGITGSSSKTKKTPPAQRPITGNKRVKVIVE